MSGLISYSELQQSAPLPVELQEIKRESGNKGGKGYDSAAY